jgi:hypothetical protein
LTVLFQKKKETVTGVARYATITIVKSLTFKKPERKNGQKTGLKGFEPLTCGLRVRRYAELSYRPALVRPSNVVDNAE